MPATDERATAEDRLLKASIILGRANLAYREKQITKHLRDFCEAQYFRLYRIVNKGA